MVLQDNTRSAGTSQALAGHDVPPGEIGTLPESERTRVLVDWNDTARPVAAVTLAELFEAQAERAPERPAPERP